jgi:heat-inducible transcriptional repressor
MTGRRSLEGARSETPELGSRQRLVLRAIVASYVGDAQPVGSSTISLLLPVHLSSASIRNTMAELEGLGLLEKPHASAGRVPTKLGLRLFVDQLLDPRDLAEYERRLIAGSVEGVSGERLAQAASALLSERTRQLGFVMAPRLERAVLGHLSLIRVSSERILAVVVSRTGVAHRRVIDDPGADDQTELDRIAALLNERLLGRTLAEARAVLAREASALRSEADRLRQRALALAQRALPLDAVPPGELVLGTWLALLDQPEFRDPDRVRALLSALEMKERLVEVLDQILEERGPGVAFGEEIGEPALRHCALVIAPCGGAEAPLGMLGVLGPSRMDYGRIIPLVDYLSQLVTERLSA